jgi:glycosyltransferase involved in cell wall biosynthesis
MKTVALITTRFVRQGPTKQLLYLIKNMDKDKIKPIIITISPEREPSLIGEFMKEDVEIIQLNLGFVKSLFFSRGLITRLIAERKVDIIHSFTYARRVEHIVYNIKGVRKIATIRNSPVQSKTGYSGKIGGFIVFYLQMKYYKYFDKIVACSESIFNLPELRNLTKITIQNGIDTSIITNNPIPHNKSVIRNKLNLPNDKVIFITISNGTVIKNIEFLIEYFKGKKDEILLIAGDGREGYRKLAKGNKNILFTGHVENIYEFYQASDIFISASYTEGLPNAVLESLLLGTPCLLSNISMHKEVIVNSKNTIGLLFDNNNVEDLGKQIELLKSSISEGTKFYCSDFILNNFSAKTMTRHYQDLYLSNN